MSVVVGGYDCVMWSGEAVWYVDGWVVVSGREAMWYVESSCSVTSGREAVWCVDGRSAVCVCVIIIYVYYGKSFSR